MKQPREGMEIITTNIRQTVTSYLASSVIQPLLLHGDALAVLKDFPDESIDVVMTSPPYWQKRQYAQEGLAWNATIRNILPPLRHCERSVSSLNFALCQHSDILTSSEACGRFSGEKLIRPSRDLTKN